MMKRTAFLLSLLAVSAVPVLGQDNTARIRGTIVSLEANVLTVATAAENRRVTLTDGFRVISVVKADLAKIVPGAYVGSGAVTQPDGTLRALEVHIFLESMRGTGEGHRPYDLGPQSTMTNGTVDVTGLVESVGGQVLTIKYKDGEKKIIVAKDTPIVAYEAGDVKALVPGAHVFIVAQRGPDGGLSTARVNVGKNGLVPPM
jgi:hypothetical protein